MPPTLTPNADGSITIPRELLDTITGTSSYEVNGHTITLQPRSNIPHGPIWEGLTPEQRAAEFLDWVKTLPSAPHLTHEQLRRESMYD